MDLRNEGGDGPLFDIGSALAGRRCESGKSVHSGTDEGLCLDWLESVLVRAMTWSTCRLTVRPTSETN